MQKSHSFHLHIYTDSHPVRKPTFLHPVTRSQSDSCNFRATMGSLRIPEFKNSKRVPFPFRKYLHFRVFLLILSFLCLIGQRMFFLNSLVQQCSNTKVTGGELSCRAAVRLTVTQFTDSQTTRDFFSFSFFDLSETPFIDGTIHMQSHSFQLFTEAN